MKRKKNLSTGCPVACGYCLVTNVENQKILWEKSTIAGINKTITFINPPPDKANVEALDGFYNFPFELLEGDIVGFNGISDPFWPYYEDELDYFMDKVAPIAKLVTCITKFPLRDHIIEKLSKIDNFRLVVSITGLDSIEKTTTRSRVKTLQKAHDAGIKAFPIIHPYIAGMSNLSFLPELKKIGYDFIDIKGLRYNPENMGHWMSSASKRYYEVEPEEELLPEDGWREKIEQSGLKLISLKDWYKSDINHSKGISLEKSQLLVDKMLSIANIVSSDSDDAVAKYSIQRRLGREYQW